MTSAQEKAHHTKGHGNNNPWSLAGLIPAHPGWRQLPVAGGRISGQLTGHDGARAVRLGQQVLLVDQLLILLVRCHQPHTRGWRSARRGRSGPLLLAPPARELGDCRLGARIPLRLGRGHLRRRMQPDLTLCWRVASGSPAWRTAGAGRLGVWCMALSATLCNQLTVRLSW